ncbi:WD40-repeat-containing domain protein [Obelidium mucronatum]|nr:WD40-repeat-containing domain protein [Obelidium mucronatum]
MMLDSPEPTMHFAHITVQHDFTTDIKAKKGSFWLSSYYNNKPSIHSTINVAENTQGETVLFADNQTIVTAQLQERGNWLGVRVAMEGLEPVETVLKGPDECIQFGHQITSLGFAPSGGHLVVGGEEGSLGVYNTGSWTRTPAVFKGHVGDITTAKFFPSSTVLLTSATDLQVKVWDAVEGTCAMTMGAKNGGHTRPVVETGIIERGRNIVTAGKDGRLLLWEVKSASVIREICDAPVVGGDPIGAMAMGTAAVCLVSQQREKRRETDEREIGTSDKLCFVGTESGCLAGYDLGSDGGPILSLKATSNVGITACAYDSSQGLVAVGSSNGIKIYDLRNTGKAIASIKRNGASILNMSFVSKDFSAFGIEMLFSTEDGSCAHVSVGETVDIVSEFVGTDIEPLSGFSVSDPWLAVGGREGIVRVYESV